MPGAVALIQSPGEADRFSVGAYFIVLCIMMMFAAMLFFIDTKFMDHATFVATEQLINTSPRQPARRSLQAWLWWRWLLSLSAIAFARNGIIVSVASYAILPYSEGKSLLLWSTFAGQAGAPLAAWAGMWWTSREGAEYFRKPYHIANSDTRVSRAVTLLHVLWAPGIIFLLVVGAFSPEPIGGEVRTDNSTPRTIHV